MGIMYKLMKHRNLNMDSNTSFNNTRAKNDRNRLLTIEGNIIETSTSTTAKSAEEHSTQNMDSSMDKQFTAEHIIQLCKFLAEKSKRNKNLYKLQQSPKKLTKSKQSQFTFQPTEYNDGEVVLYQNEALPLLTKHKSAEQRQKQTEDDSSKNIDLEQQNMAAVLSTRLSPDINSLNISSNTTTTMSCALQHQQQQQQQQQQQHQQHINSYQRQSQQHQPHQQQQQQQPQPTQTQGKRDILLKIRRQIFERKRLRENAAFEPQAFNNSQVWRPW